MLVKSSVLLSLLTASASGLAIRADNSTLVTPPVSSTIPEATEPASSSIPESSSTPAASSSAAPPAATTPAIAPPAATPPAVKPTKFGIVLFDGFQVLDAYGPLDTLATLQKHANITVDILTTGNKTVSSVVPGKGPVGASFVATHAIEAPRPDLEVLLVPGGLGTRDTAASQHVVDFVKLQYPKLKYLLTVCTGSALAARAGVLDGRNATTNKQSFDEVVPLGPKTNWINEARWVVDGNIYTSSGISAGMDMVYGFITDIWGQAVADDLAEIQEYVRNTDRHNDPFADKDGKEPIVPESGNNNTDYEQPSYEEPSYEEPEQDYDYDN
ncbi:hypothetical protein VHEMI03038 [[Torrubiella] hemipterigena]|uniref:DJ-1/PfpI domain-containing protein n=1 Tax=[Torrubiella] hemipterigena TaxID=1531966 RepID=A0A0A1T9N6_9HYPO|nr:hypothetical protein VHEMI03038 [[Torrubiella] hemipterigena]